MATYTTYTDGTTIKKQAAPRGNSSGTPYLLVADYDATRRNGAAADIFEIADIPAGTLVLHAVVETIAADATQTLNVGDGGDPNGFADAVDVGTLGNIANGAGAYVVAAGKFYATADTLDLEVPAGKAWDTLKARVSILCVSVP